MFVCFSARMPLLTATSAFGLGRRRWSSPEQCYATVKKAKFPNLHRIVRLIDDFHLQRQWCVIL